MNSTASKKNSLANQALGTAAWTPLEKVKTKQFSNGDLWLSRTIDDAETAIGHNDDRHVLLTCGSRGGKGASIIINNLCLWPGSAVVIDPKGENAIVTARRRGGGSEYCYGLGQTVHILDPFNVVHRDDDDFSDLKSRFNPLDAINPESEEALDDAARLANAIVVVQSNNDPFWEESARSLIRALILHVLTDEQFEGIRNLVTVRQLLLRGDWITLETIRVINRERQDSGEDLLYEPPAMELLWEAMQNNPEFGGVISGTGEKFATMSDKMKDSILAVAHQNTEFIDSPGMQRSLQASDFQLSDLKTNPQGVTLYLSLPQRHMAEHFRWLRMLTTLTVTEMEQTRGQPACGHRVLLLMDEFAGLKKMDIIQTASAQIAGYGVKLFFVVQSLVQLKETYKDSWEVFLSNAGIKIFFSIDDGFTRDYLSKFLGETEVLRESSSSSFSEGISNSISRSSTTTNSFSETLNFSSNLFGRTYGGGGSTQSGTSYSSGISDTSGTNSSQTRGTSTSVHKRPLVTPDEIGRFFARVDDKFDAAYPGLAIVAATGENPMVLRKANYFEDRDFRGLFDPHPDHTPPLKLPALEERLRLEDLERKRQEQEAADAERRRRAEEERRRRAAAEAAEAARRKQRNKRIALFSSIAVVVISGGAYILSIPTEAEIAAAQALRDNARQACVSQFQRQAYCGCLITSLDDQSISDNDWQRLGRDFTYITVIASEYTSLPDAITTCRTEGG